MNALDKQDPHAQSLALFNKVQSKSVLFIAQENPYFSNRDDLILKFGLSLASIKSHLQQLDIIIKDKSLRVNDSGVAKLLKIAKATKGGMNRYEIVVKYHKLVDLATFLELVGVSVEQLITILNSLAVLGNEPQQILAKSVLLKIPNDIFLKHKDYSDELTEGIKQSLIEKKAH